MGRKQTLIIYPHLNDCNGDISKPWYVEYKFRVPGEPDIRKERIYKELNVGTAEMRYELAKKIIAEKRRWLDSGDHLIGLEKERVFVDELMYNNAARLYGKLKKETPTIRQNISAYLAMIKQQKTFVTYSNIQTKLRTFVAWLENNNLNVNVKNI